MKSLRALTAGFLSILLALPSSLAQQIAQNSEVLVVPAGDKFLRWYAHEGRTYFIQASDPNDHLRSWVWADIIEHGEDQQISYEVDGTADNGFFRLHYTDEAPPPGVSLEDWDADGDGLPNALELLLQSNPLKADTSGDGIPDGWAYAHGLTITANNATGAFQGGDATNLEAFNLGVQANPNATLDDHDGNGIDNHDDAFPWDERARFKPAPEASYAVIPLGVPTGYQGGVDGVVPGSLSVGINLEFAFFTDSSFGITALGSDGTVLLTEDRRSTITAMSQAPGAYKTWKIQPGGEWTAVTWPQPSAAKGVGIGADGEVLGVGLIPLWDNGSDSPADGPSLTLRSWLNDGTTSTLLYDRVPAFSPAAAFVDSHMALQLPTLWQTAIDDDGQIFTHAFYPTAQGHKLQCRKNSDILGNSELDPGGFALSREGHIMFYDDNHLSQRLLPNGGSQLPGTSSQSTKLAQFETADSSGQFAAISNGQVWLRQIDGSWKRLRQTREDVIADRDGNGDSGVAAIDLNARGEILVDPETLWRNGSSHAISDLVGDSSWSDFHVTQINDSGMLAGFATAAATDETPSPEPQAVILLPVDLISDLNNDGQITAADNPLRDAALAGGATDEIKDKGTEFIFHNDDLSNGIWDKDDNDPAKPATEKDDDDAEEIVIKPGITEGEVWLEHPAIAGLSFYKTRECNPGDKVNLSPTSKFAVSASNPFPDKLFMRAGGTLAYPDANPQFEGDLVLKIKVGTNGQEIEAVKMKLTLVKGVGSTKYFHAARDYMFENNSRVCVRREKVGSSTNPSYKRIISMLHEKSEMKAVDSFHRNPKLYGIDAIATEFASFDVAINGNFCFYSSVLRLNRPPQNAMTDKCHGRLITAGTVQASSSTGGSNIYESAIADFIGWNAQSGIDIKTGIVPISPMTYTEALGGFGSNLIEEGGDHPWYGIANAGNKKVFFVATPFSIGYSGAGNRVALRQALLNSGCPPLPGGQPGEIQCIYGDGGSSLGLAYRIKSSNLIVKTKGEKHVYVTPQMLGRGRGDYFINTYLVFRSQNPR